MKPVTRFDASQWAPSEVEVEPCVLVRLLLEFDKVSYEVASGYAGSIIFTEETLMFVYYLSETSSSGVNITSCLTLRILPILTRYTRPGTLSGTG